MAAVAARSFTRRHSPHPELHQILSLAEGEFDAVRGGARGLRHGREPCELGRAGGARNSTFRAPDPRVRVTSTVPPTELTGLGSRGLRKCDLAYSGASDPLGRTLWLAPTPRTLRPTTGR